MTAFERNFATAANRRHKDELDTLMVDSWTITHADGSRSGKRAVIAEMTRPLAAGIVSEKTVVDSVAVVRLNADSAVVTAEIARIEERVHRSDTTYFRVTDIVARRSGRLQLVKSRESHLR
jgi:hypothetical protein